MHSPPHLFIESLHWITVNQNLPFRTTPAYAADLYCTSTCQPAGGAMYLHVSRQQQQPCTSDMLIKALSTAQHWRQQLCTSYMYKFASIKPWSHLQKSIRRDANASLTTYNSFAIAGRRPDYSGPQCWDLVLIQCASPGRGELIGVC